MLGGVSSDIGGVSSKKSVCNSSTNNDSSSGSSSTTTNAIDGAIIQTKIAEDAAILGRGIISSDTEMFRKRMQGVRDLVQDEVKTLLGARKEEGTGDHRYGESCAVLNRIARWSEKINADFGHLVTSHSRINV